MAEERLAKGLNLLQLAKMLRKAKLVDKVGLTGDDVTCLHGLIVPTGWYPHAFFERVIVAVHQHLLGGTDSAAKDMGRASAQAMLGGPHRIFVVDGDVVATGKNMTRIWPHYFNFGTVAV